MSLVAALGVAILAGVWFVLSQWSPLEETPIRSAATVTERRGAPGTQSALPKENLVLIDRSGRRFYPLRARPSAAPADPVELQAMRIGPDGTLQQAGRYRWDPARETLTELLSKRSWAVEYDLETGSLRAPTTGTIQVTTEPPGAACWINGTRAGVTPVERSMRTGLAQVRVLWENGREKSAPVYVPAGDVGGVKFRSGGRP
jgi:hypothetical protein